MTDPSEGRPGEGTRDPLIGARIDSRYEILRRLGRGGMSTVYAARHLLLHKEVAVKVLKEELAHDQRVIDMIFREARTVARLGHPSIVNALDVGITPEGLAYIVLELLEGVSLGLEIARCGRIDTARAVRIATQVASAMAAAHGAGVVHRDLKPENIFLIGNAGHKDTPDACKVLDFGVAKHTLAAMHGATLTSYGGVVGTPGYMAPEQLLTPDRVDHRVDIYALGVVLFEMLSGQPPYHDVQTLPELVVRVQQGGAPRLNSVAPSVPEALAEIVDMAMARSPDDRFQTMAEFGRGLRSYAVESGAFTDSPWLLAQGVTPPPVYIPHGFGTTPEPPAAPNPHGVTPSTLPALMVVPNSPVPLPVSRREPTLSRGVTPSPSPSPMVISAGLPTPPQQRIIVGQPTPSPLSVDGVAPTMLPPGVGGPTPSPLTVAVAPPAAPRRSWPLVVGVLAVVLAGAGIALRATVNTEMELSVTSTTPAAVATVRGSDYRLPAHVRLKRHADPEMVQVRAPGFQDKSLWVTLDKDLSLVADLTPAQAAPAVVEPAPSAPTAPAPPAVAVTAAVAPAPSPVVAPSSPAAPSSTGAPPTAPAPSTASRPSTSTSHGDRTPSSTTRAAPSALIGTSPAPAPTPVVVAPTAAPIAAPAPAPLSPAPVVAPVVAAPATPAPLPAAAITAQVSAHRAAVDACIAEDPSVGGHLMLRVAVRADGTVESASAESGATAAVRSCIVRQAKTWRFPAGSGRAEGRTSIDLD